MIRNVSSAYAKVQKIMGYHRLPDEESKGRAKTVEDFQTLAIDAARLSQGSTKDKAAAKQSWEFLSMAVRHFSLDPTDVIDIDLAPGLSVIEGVMRAGDWPSCRIIHSSLPSGYYDHERIKRDERTLVLLSQRVNQPDFGWKAIGETAYYVGDLVDGKMEGYGKKVYSGDEVFEGSFSNNTLHGRCTYHDSHYPEDNFIGYYHYGSLQQKEPMPQNNPLSSLLAALRLPTIESRVKKE